MGYRLIVQISHPKGTETKKFRVKNRQRLYVGRLEGDIVLPDRRVSRRHLGLAVVDGRLLVADLNSSFGTHLGGKPIRQIRLRAGETLKLGSSTLTLKAVQRGWVPAIRLPRFKLPRFSVKTQLPKWKWPAWNRKVVALGTVVLLVAGVIFFSGISFKEKKAEPRLYYSAGFNYKY